MQVSVENTSALERRMTIGVPAERIEAEVNKRLQQTAQKAKIPGFRPGKVPMSVIRQRYEADARQVALGNVIQASFYEAVVEQKLNPAGAPSVEPKVFEKGKELVEMTRSLGQSAEMVVYPGAGHGFNRSAATDAEQRTLEFFQARLMGKR